MRSVTSRLARLEQLSRLGTAPQRLRIQYGYLTTLPDDYIGPRHVVTVRRLPPGPGAYSGEDCELSAAVCRLKAVALRHPVMPVTDGFPG
jgi:hypothetical protein